MCPGCHQRMDGGEASGRGTSTASSSSTRPSCRDSPIRLPVALIELEEGMRLVANLSGIVLEQCAIGMPVEVEFIEVEPGYVLYAFHRKAGSLTHGVQLQPEQDELRQRPRRGS